MAGTITVGTISDGTNSASATDAIKGSARAWVNFNLSGGVASIRSSYNVSSVVRNATGDVSINFTSALTDANYSFAGTCGNASSNAGVAVLNHLTGSASTASSARVAYMDVNGTLSDRLYNTAVFYR